MIALEIISALKLLFELNLVFLVHFEVFFVTAYPIITPAAMHSVTKIAFLEKFVFFGPAFSIIFSWSYF